MVTSAPFDTIHRFGDVEIRWYPSLLVATVRDSDEKDAFRILFRYISGHNDEGMKIPMTAPVITSGDPALSPPPDPGERAMSFVLPENETVATAPAPRDPKIHLEPVAARQIAVLRFSGQAGREDVAGYREQLLTVLRENRVPHTGGVFLMRYNSPWTPGFLRHNEVAVMVMTGGS